MAITYKIKGVKKASVLYSLNASTIGKEQIVFARAVGMDVPQTNIDFMGDNQVETLYSIDKVIATVEADKFTDTVLEKVYGKTSAHQSGEITRYYFGNEAEELPPNVGLEVDMLALDEVGNGNARTVRITIFKAKTNPYSLPSANSKEKHGMAFGFEARKTTTDLIGSALVSGPTDGAYYSIAILST